MHRPWSWWRCRIEFPHFEIIVRYNCKICLSNLIAVPFAPSDIFAWMNHIWYDIHISSTTTTKLISNAFWFEMHELHRCMVVVAVVARVSAVAVAVSIALQFICRFSLQSDNFVSLFFSSEWYFTSVLCSVLYTCTFCLPVIILEHMKYNRIQFQFTVHCACNTHFFCCSQLWRRWSHSKCSPKKKTISFISFLFLKEFENVSNFVNFLPLFSCLHQLFHSLHSIQE